MANVVHLSVWPAVMLSVCLSMLLCMDAINFEGMWLYIHCLHIGYKDGKSLAASSFSQLFILGPK